MILLYLDRESLSQQLLPLQHLPINLEHRQQHFIYTVYSRITIISPSNCVSVTCQLAPFQRMLLSYVIHTYILY